MRAGIDTWSPGWYLDPDGDTAAALRARATVPSARGAQLLPERVAGYRVGWFPGSALAFAEGHPGGAGELGAPEGLPAAYAHLRLALRGAGLAMPEAWSWRLDPRLGAQGRTPGAAGIRRIDLALDVAVPNGEDGLALLDAVALLNPPRIKKRVIYGEDGRVETVAWHGYGGRRMLGRVYDKGVESGTAEPGELIRLEDQRRYASNVREPVEHFTPATIHQLHARRFAPLTQAAGLTAGDARALAGYLAELVADGEITERKAVALAGHLLLGGYAQRSSSTARRHRADLRKLGLILVTRMSDPGGRLLQGDRHTVELGEIFRRVLGDRVWNELQAEAA